MTDLLAKTVELAIAERERRAEAMDLIHREDLAPEYNALGITRWYLHPELEQPSTRALYFFELEILEGSHSGKLLHQGGIVHYVLEGNGHSIVNGVRHDWEATDGIVIPILEAGSTFQHFNDGSSRVRMLVTWPNFDSALGPEGGVALTILEPAPATT
jgi:hypothetical protein